MTEIVGIISVRKTMRSKTQTTDSKVRSMIYGNGRGWVFTPNSFRGLGSRDAIDSAISRLWKEGTVRKLARGLYDYPVQDPVLGTVAPSADQIARALVVRDVIRLQPSGAYAANILGLSEQVPSRVVFLTDGPARKVTLGKREIILQRTTPRNMATAGRKSGTIIQALRYLGKDQVDDRVMSILRRQISDEERPKIHKDLRHAPEWIADLLRPITQPVS
jgi:predicted transcriptional regulator of viral defense system